MKSKADFENLFSNDLKKAMAQLEAKRKTIAEKNSFKNYKRNLIWATIGCAALLILSASLPDTIPMSIDKSSTSNNALLPAYMSGVASNISFRFFPDSSSLDFAIVYFIIYPLI